jgi:hypothetical protein
MHDQPGRLVEHEQVGVLPTGSRAIGSGTSGEERLGRLGLERVAELRRAGSAGSCGRSGLQSPSSIRRACERRCR